MARKTTKTRRPIEPKDESQEAPEPDAPEPETPREAATGRPTMSKVDAVKAALAEGVESPEDGVAFIQKRFGIEIGRQHFSATKSQLKRREGGGAPKGKRAPKRRQVAEPAPQTAPPAQPTATGETDMIDDRRRQIAGQEARGGAGPEDREPLRGIGPPTQGPGTPPSHFPDAAPRSPGRNRPSPKSNPSRGAPLKPPDAAATIEPVGGREVAENRADFRQRNGKS
jgi:hypothetical protein